MEVSDCRRANCRQRQISQRSKSYTHRKGEANSPEMTVQKLYPLEIQTRPGGNGEEKGNPVA